MKALVLGYGRSGRAAEALLKAKGCEVVVLDDRGAPSAAVSPNTSDEVPAEASFAVVSPGVALTHPWIAACRAHGIPLKSELQLGCEELKHRGWKLLAVTGSKGKSSVVKIVADALNLAGEKGVACGNYGVPVSEVALAPCEENVPRWAVVEVSSFMMETTTLPSDTFEAAAILNLQEDHLDRHGRVEVYHALKRKLLTMALVGLIGEGAQLEKDSTEAVPLFAGSYFDNPVLRTNGVCAVGLMRAAGLGDATIASAFASFEPLAHRMNLIAEIGGVRYIDDSKATSLAALAAGVEMAAAISPSAGSDAPRTILLIAGGLPKGDDPRSVLPILTKRARKVYLIGKCAEAFADAWKSSVDCEICGTMEKAVAAARRDAVAGDQVLLSPGTASFDQFKSFGERGDVFARIVQKGKTE